MPSLTLAELQNYHLTSRSAIETYQSCPRKRYLEYFYNGTGLKLAGSNIALVTGTEVHHGIGKILEEVKVKRKIEPDLIDYGSGIAKDSYLKVNNLWGPGLVLDSQQEYTKKEQLALIEGLIRAWGLVELPKLVERFDIIDVERELLYPLTSNILLQSKCDCLLREKGTKDYFVYSLKTSKAFYYKTERSYKKDLQGITEILAVEEWFREQNNNIQKSLEGLSLVEVGQQVGQIMGYLNKQLLPERVGGVKFCYLIKGERREDRQRVVTSNDDNNNNDLSSNRTDNNNWVTDSPLIKGYRKFTPSGLEFAHSDQTIKPENKSGYGKLGKGWEKFNIWECEEVGFVKGWVEKLAGGEIQSELGNVLQKCVVTPVEYFRNKEELESRKKQMVAIESTVQHNMIQLNVVPEDAPEWKKGLTDVYFWQNTHSCHFPWDCQFLPMCFLEEPFNGKPVSPEVRDNPMESGMYQSRIPHHEPEKEKFVQIEKMKRALEHNI